MQDTVLNSKISVCFASAQPCCWKVSQRGTCIDHNVDRLPEPSAAGLGHSEASSMQLVVNRGRSSLPMLVACHRGKAMATG